MRGSAWYHSHIWSRILLLIWRCTFNLALRCRLLLAVALERPAVWIGEKRLQYFPDWVWLNILEPQTRWLHSSKYTHTHILVCQAETMRRVVQGTLPSNLQDFVAFWAKTVAVCHLQSSHICHIGSLSQFAHDFYEDLEPFHWTQILFGPVQTICGFHKWHYPNSWMVYNPKQPWMIKRGPFMETPIWPMAFHQSILISVTPGVIMIAYGVAKLRGRKMSLDAVPWMLSRFERAAGRVSNLGDLGDIEGRGGDSKEQ